MAPIFTANRKKSGKEEDAVGCKKMAVLLFSFNNSEHQAVKFGQGTCDAFLYHL